MVLFFVYSREVRRVLPDPRYFLLAQVWSKNTHRAAAGGVYLMSATLANNLIITGLPTATTTTTTTARTTTTTATTNGLPNRYLCMKTCQAGQVFRTHSRGNCAPLPPLHTVLLSADNDIHWFLSLPGIFAVYARFLTLALPLSHSLSLSPSPFPLWFSPDFF